MPLPDDEPACPQFQPNIFDPSRCHDCLRQRRLHDGAGDRTEAKATPKAIGGAKMGTGMLTPIPSQAEDRDTSSSKEDWERLSVGSSYCDVSGGWPGHEERALCILSPDCELYVCDGDDDNSTDSCLDQSDYRDPSGSGSAEDESLPLRMTRLDPAPRRPTRHAWMDEPRSRNDSSRRSGLKEDKEKRESGYFSLGRAAGSHSLRDNKPPEPFRHFERGHPVFSSKTIEPKDTIPFRNPNLGVASERQVPELLDKDLPVEIPPPDPYDIAVEVEAQVGPRSPSPTPFKIAESLASTGRKSFISSYDRGNASHQQLGRFGSLPSRSSSPARGNSPLRGGDVFSRTFDGTDSGSRGSLQRIQSGTLPRNFQSLAGSVKSQSRTVADFRSALRKTDLNGRGRESRSSSPGRTSLRKTETGSGSLLRLDSRASSPSRRTYESRYDSRGSSPPRRAYSSFSQSVLRKSESVTSLDGRSHHGRCGSPIREGYDIESQAVLRNLAAGNALHGQDDENSTCSPTRHQSRFQKTEFNTAGRCQEGPERRSFKTTSEYPLRKNDSSASFNGRQSRNASPSRRSYEPPTQSILRRSEASVRGGHDSLSSKQRYGAPRQTAFGKSELSDSPKRRNASPSGNATSDPPGYSILRRATNGEAGRLMHRKNFDSKSDLNHSPRSWRQSAPSPRSSSLSRSASPVGKNNPTGINFQPQRSPGSTRSRVRRRSLENRSPVDAGLCHRARSPSPSRQIKVQSHTFSQSSVDSSESGRLSGGSTGRNKEEYATIADLPKVKMIHQREDQKRMETPHNRQRSRRQELFKPASHSLSKHPFRAWEDNGETDKDRWYDGGSGYLSRAHSSTSLQVLQSHRG
uniref:serine/arginine repetitive matrix protein 2 n=1 Tax=Doryrhamphus excisus TaxID=161450 RepID=UPI0025AE26FF|nr:serine/arginine repetitive matrix protein 2 [Doryrhamphus excisus]